MSGESKQTTLALAWRYAADFRRVYATSTFSLIGDCFDSRIIFGLMSPVLKEDPAAAPLAEAVYQLEVILPFPTLKNLRTQIDGHIKAVERQFGEIKTPISPEEGYIS